MRLRSTHSRLNGFICFAAFSAVLGAPFLARAAATTPNECSLSGLVAGALVGCPSNNPNPLPYTGYMSSVYSIAPDTTTPGGPYYGARADVPSAVSPIQAWGVCRWVDNSSGSPVFVPFKTSREWENFREAAPTLLNGKINLVSCAVPSTSANATMVVMPPFDGCTQITANTPTVYGRTNVTLFPFPAASEVGFTCHNGATSMMTDIQFIAGDSASPDSNGLSWKPHFAYSPDVTLASDQSVVYPGTAVTLTWSIKPYVTGQSVTCTTSSGGWGPDANCNPLSGSSVITVTSSTSFSLTTKIPNSDLVSVATTGVTVIPPPPPPPPPTPPPPPPPGGGGSGDGGGGDGGGDGGGN